MARHRRTLLSGAAAGLAAAALGGAVAPPRADAAPITGLADQHGSSLSDPRVKQVAVRHARLVVPWDGMRHAYQVEEVDAWMRAARESGISPLVTFGRQRASHGRLPTPAEYRLHINRFIKRYPFVREYSPWNEPNIARSPKLRNPRRMAAYYRMLRAACRGCTVLGADLVDSSSMDDWLREYLKELKGQRPRVWGLHNYVDAHSASTWGTRTMLRMVRGEIWFTETGGIYRRKGKGKFLPKGDRRRLMKTGSTRALPAARRVFRLAALSPRIRRVYLYHWRAQDRYTWDSALIAPDGTARPTFSVFANAVRRGAPNDRTTPAPGPAPDPSPAPAYPIR